MKKKLIMVVIAVTLVLGIVVAQAAPALACQGLTPGFWKNHTDVWVTYNTSQTLENVFNVPDYLGLDNYTLLQALQFGGGPGNVGGAQILFRAAVAALLNAEYFKNASYTYEYTTAQVISMTNAALASGNRATMISLAENFDYWNNQQAPSP